MESQPIPSSYIRMVARELEGAVTTEQLLLGTGLTADSMGLVDSVSLEQLLGVIGNAGRCTGDPAIGLHLGSLLHPSAHGSVGWATINSPTLGEAMAVLSRYSTLQVPFIHYQALADGDWFRVRITRLNDLADQDRALTECALLLLHHVVSYMARHTLADTEISLDYARPAYADRYVEVFGCPVTYDQDVVEYRFPSHGQTLPNSTADADMYQIALAQCQNAERRLQEQPHADAEVLALLETRIEEHLTLQQVAYRLNISPRTLIRRLKKRETSFQAISDRLYAQTAADYLRRTDISVNAVAQLLGYRDPANFRRSFKRWYQMNPSQYRKQRV